MVDRADPIANPVRTRGAVESPQRLRCGGKWIIGVESWNEGGRTAASNQERWFDLSNPYLWLTTALPKLISFHFWLRLGSSVWLRKNPIGIVRPARTHDVPGGFGQLARERLGRDHVASFG